MNSGKKILGKSNISSLNYDLSPLPTAEVRDATNVTDNTTHSPEDTQYENIDPEEKVPENSSSLPAPSSIQQTPVKHVQFSSNTSATASAFPSLGFNATTPIRQFQPMHGGDSSLVASLEQQRHLALQLLANQASSAGYIPHNNVHGPTYSNASNYGLANIPQPGQHPILMHQTAPIPMQWSQQSPFASPSRFPDAYNMHIQQQQPLPSSGYGPSNIGRDSYHNGVQSMQYNQYQTHRNANNQTYDDQYQQHSTQSKARPTKLDKDSRLLMSDNRTPVHNALMRAQSDHRDERDIRLRDSTHGKVPDVLSSDSTAEPALKVADVAMVSSPQEKDSTVLAPQDLHPGKRYHGEPVRIFPGDKPTKKSGTMWLSHLGVRQRALLEASQTLFKGELSIFLLSDRGQPFRERPVAVFLLGAVGELTVTLSGVNISLQDNRNACLLTCDEESQAEEWVEFLCASPMANKPILRNNTGLVPSGIPSAPVGLPPTAVLQSPRGKSLFKDLKLDDDDERRSEGNPKQPGAGAGSGLGELNAADVAIEGYDVDSRHNLPQHDLPAILQEMEAKIEENVSTFEKKMQEKEEEMVKECKYMYKADKKKAKDDITALKKKLLSVPGQLPEELAKEERKLQIWLEQKNIKIEAIAAKRLAATEKAFDEFRHEEYERLCRVNNKIKAKMAVLQERQRRVKAAQQKNIDLIPLPGNNAGNTTSSGGGGPGKAAAPATDKIEAKFKKKSKNGKQGNEMDENSLPRSKSPEALHAVHPQVQFKDSNVTAAQGSKGTNAEGSEQANITRTGKENNMIGKPSNAVDKPTQPEMRKSFVNNHIAKTSNVGSDKKMPSNEVDEPILDLKSKNPVVPTQKESAVSMFSKDTGNTSGVNPVKGDGARALEQTKASSGERPASPPIPTHQEGGSRYVAEFKGAKRKNKGKEKVFKVGTEYTEETLNPKGTYGASRWDDVLDPDEPQEAKRKPKVNVSQLYAGAGEVGSLDAPIKNVGQSPEALLELHKQRMEYGRTHDEENTEEGNTKSNKKASKLQDSGSKGGKPAKMETSGKSTNRDMPSPSHEQPDEYEPNPNAKPLTGKGMSIKPATTTKLKEPITAAKMIAKQNEKPLRKGTKAYELASKEWGTGRKAEMFKAGKPQFMLSYDSKMNLRHNREEYCTDMAIVLQRFWRGCKQKWFSLMIMAPMLEQRKKQQEAAEKIQRCWRGMSSRPLLLRSIEAAIRQLQFRAMYSFVCFMFLFIAKCMRRRVYREKLIHYILKTTLKKRQSLIMRRKAEALHVHKHFNITPPNTGYLHSVPKGVTTELKRAAQIRAERRMVMGPLASVVESAAGIQKSAGRFFSRLFQYNLAERDEHAADKLHSHIAAAKEKQQDFTAGYKTMHNVATSVHDVRAAHIREYAIKSFVRMKEQHKQHILQQKEDAVRAEEDSDEDDP